MSTVNVPTLLYVGQASGIVVASVTPPVITPTGIKSLRLYRAFTNAGPWTKSDERNISPTSVWNNVFDLSPSTTAIAYYAVTAFDGTTESALSSSLAFAAIAKPQALTPALGISQGVFGPQAILGSDVYIDPVAREAVVGPNGDLMMVIGLECLAQDLQTRLQTELGELLLHNNFGNGRDRLIGSGQGDPIAQAQILQTRIIDIMQADPRVAAVIDVVIARVDDTSWIANATIIAIGSEDTARQNLVFPFYLQP